MTSGANTCVAWLLLGSYVVLLGVGGFGVWVTVNNFGVDVPLPPTPVENDTDIPTSPRPYRSYDESPLRIYAKATWRYANNLQDPRLYVGVPCSVSVLVATCVLVAGLYSRKFFTTTFSVYSSLALWAGNLGLTCIYQSNVMDVDQEYFHQTVGWVLGFQIGLLLLMLLQVLLSVWELRRQKADWPTINLSRLLTVEALLVTARMTLAIYTLSNVFYSQPMRGFYSYTNTSVYKRPKLRYPLYLEIITSASALYGFVSIVETTGSYFFGSLSSRLTSFTCFLSALCYGTIAVLSSQVVVKTLMGPPFWVYPEGMYYGIAASVISFLHLVSCLFFSTAARTPPSTIKEVFDALKSGDFPSVNYSQTSESFAKGVGSLRKIIRNEIGGSSVHYNLGSTIFCIISAVICLSTWRGPLDWTWGIMVMLFAYTIIFTRTFPPAVMELYYCRPAGHVPRVQRVVTMVLENIVLFVGSVATLALSWLGGYMFCAVANFFYILFQCMIIKELVKAQGEQTSDTKPLIEDGPEESGLQDEDKESGLRDEDKESGLRDEDKQKKLPEALAEV